MWLPLLLVLRSRLLLLLLQLLQLLQLLLLLPLLPLLFEPLPFVPSRYHRPPKA